MSRVTIDTNKVWDIGKASEATQKRTIELADALQGQVKSLTHIEDFIQLYDERLCRQIRRMKNEANRCGMAASYIFKIAENYEGVDKGMTSILTTLNVATALTRSENDEAYKAVLPKDWIPPVMQLGGDSIAERYLTKLINKNNTENRNWKTKWDQEKIDALWESCELYYDQTGLQLDPRLLLAVIFQEGTGSFNTSITNKAADGQNGYEADFAKDLMKARSLLFGKLFGYIQYGEDFKRVVDQSQNYPGINGSGTFAKYANWKTPVLYINGSKPWPYVYAKDGTWNENVEIFYNMLSANDHAMEDYSNYLLSVDKSVVSQYIQVIPDFSFSVFRNAQDSGGHLNGQYTVSAK